MKKSTKGTLAASAAAVLLLGGFGTHAAWSDGQDVGGTDINTGHLSLVTVSCGDWQLTVGSVTSVYDAATHLFVPGDLLTRVCTFKVDVAGAVSATLTADAPSVLEGGVAAPDLVATATYVDNSDGSTISPTTVLVDNEVIKATVTVSLPAAVPRRPRRTSRQLWTTSPSRPPSPDSPSKVGPQSSLSGGRPGASHATTTSFDGHGARRHPPRG